MIDLVSVIIPTYKRSNTLSRAIDSVLLQEYKNLEVIVVDDNNPTDEERKKTELVMANYKSDMRVHYYQHPYNKNGSAARNTGIDHAKGQFIMFLDDDDEFLPGKILSQVNHLKSLDDTWGVCYCQYERYKNNRPFLISADRREGGLLVEALGRNLFVAAGSNLLIRKTVVDEINGFDETFARNQDQEFLVRILQRYKLAYTDVKGLRVHTHQSKNSSVKFDKLTEQYIDQFKPVIDSLDEREKDRVYLLLDLQLFRAFCSQGEIRKALNMITSNRITLLSAASYICHIVARSLKHESYGYRQ